jgi:dTDP-glucose pyrophosphorylase
MAQKNKQCFTETCVVLAGGLGTRLNTVTNGRNKHSIPIAGKLALLHVLEPILASPSVQKVVIVIQPCDKGWMKDLVGSLSAQSEYCLCIQPAPNGTLAAVKCALSLVHTESFSVHYGDNIFGWKCLPDFSEFVGNFGVVDVEESSTGQLASGFIEKPVTLDGFQQPRILSGFFRFKKDVFLRISETVSISPNGELELTAILNRMLAVPLAISVRSIDVGWTDFGTPENIVRAEQVLRERKESAVRSHDIVST